MIGQNLPVTYRFNGTNAFTTVNYIVQYSTLDIVIQDLVTGRGKSFGLGHAHDRTKTVERDRIKPDLLAG